MKSYLSLSAAVLVSLQASSLAEDPAIVEVAPPAKDEVAVEVVGTRGGVGAPDVDTTVLRGGGAPLDGMEDGPDIKDETDTDTEIVIEDGEPPVVKTDDDVKVDVTTTDGGVIGGEIDDPRIFFNTAGPGGPEVQRNLDTGMASPAAKEAPETAPAKAEEKEVVAALDLDEIAVKALDLAKGQTKAQGFSVGKRTTQPASATKAVKQGKRVFLK